MARLHSASALLGALAVAVPVVTVSPRQVPRMQETVDQRTELEQLASMKGQVVRKDYTNLDIIYGINGAEIEFTCMSFREPISGEAVFGLSVSVKEARSELRQTTFVDEKDFQSITTGLRYIASVDPDKRFLEEFEVVYSTVEGLTLTTFSRESGMTASVSCEQLGRATAWVNVEDLQRVAERFGEAMTLINGLKKEDD